MISMIRNWIRAIVREETAKATTLRGLKPGQTFNVTNDDGTVDRVTVKGPKAAKPEAKAKAKAKKVAFFRASKKGANTIQSMRDSDPNFSQRYEQAKSWGVLDSEVLIYEQTGGYKAHSKNGLRIYRSTDPDNRLCRHTVRIKNFCRRNPNTNEYSKSRISFQTAEEANKSAEFRIPLYHEICAEQARKMKGRKS